MAYPLVSVVINRMYSGFLLTLGIKRRDSMRDKYSCHYAFTPTLLSDLGLISFEKMASTTFGSENSFLDDLDHK